jgi:hypothetical protein
MKCIGFKDSAVKLSYNRYPRPWVRIIYLCLETPSHGRLSAPRPTHRTLIMSTTQIGLLVLFSISSFGFITLYIDFLHERRIKKDK